MNLIGKIFIVLILVMSIFFMALAVSVYSTHQNWKDLVSSTDPSKPPGLRQQLDRLKQDNAELTDKIEQYKNQISHERAARRTAISVLESKVREKENLFQDRNQKYEALFAQQNSLIAAVNDAQRQVDQLKQQIVQVRGEILQAQQARDDQYDRVRELTDQMHEAEGLRRRLQQRLNELSADFAQANTVLKAHDLTIDSPVDNIPPKVQGTVLAVGRDMIEVSIGSHDGLKKGHTIMVSRGGKDLGRAQIFQVNPDRAVGKIKYRNAPIQEGDSVQTKTEIR